MSALTMLANREIIKSQNIFVICIGYGPTVRFLQSFTNDLVNFHFIVCGVYLYSSLLLCYLAGILAKAEGLAILTVVKVGFLVTARAGSGIVIAKLGNRSELYCTRGYLLDVFVKSLCLKCAEC